LKIIFVNTKKNQCGVHQYGLLVFDAIKNNSVHNVEYLSADSIEQVSQKGLDIDCDMIIYNFHPGSLRFVNEKMKRKYNVPSIAIVHEPKLFDFNYLNEHQIFQYAIFSDAGTTDYLKRFRESGRLFSTGRVLFEYKENSEKSKIPTFGTIGFASLSKGFDRIINLVQNEFDEAIIRFNIPMNNSVFNDEDGARKYDDYFRSLIKKPGIKLEITHDFYDRDDFIKYLSNNSVNIFPYDCEDNHGGISSSLDNALMSKSAIAITKADIFRHVLKYDLPITLEDHNLKQILENGNSPLKVLYDSWSATNFAKDFMDIINRIPGEQ